MIAARAVGAMIAVGLAGSCTHHDEPPLVGAPYFRVVTVQAAGDPAAVTLADVDRDGMLDLVVANPEAGTISVFLSDHGERFSPAPGSPVAAGHLPSDVAVGDFDGDGHEDLVVANHQAPYVSLLLGDGKGRFTPARGSPFTTGVTPHSHGVVAGHFCGSAAPLDAVVDSWGSSEVELLVGDGAGRLASGPRFAAGPGTDAPIRAADLDGNGTLDLVVPGLAIGRWNANTVSVLLGDGHCGFHAAAGSPFPAGAEPWSVVVGDLDGNGAPDLVIVPYGPKVQDPAQDGVTILLADGRGGFRPASDSPVRLPGCASPFRAAIGDFDGDHRQDIAVTCLHSRRLFLLLARPQGGYEITWIGLDATDAYTERGLAAADLDGDGRSDLVVTDSRRGVISVLLSR